jgi:hypothetical protein
VLRESRLEKRTQDQFSRRLAVVECRGSGTCPRTKESLYTRCLNKFKIGGKLQHVIGAKKRILRQEESFTCRQVGERLGFGIRFNIRNQSIYCHWFVSLLCIPLVFCSGMRAPITPSGGNCCHSPAVSIEHHF